MQLCYTEYCCFICLWGSSIRKSHNIQDKCPSSNLKSSEKNAPNDSLINSNDILLPPLHIKLELIKNFVNSTKKDGEVFQYLRSKFPRLSDARIKKGILVDPQIRKILKSPPLDQILERKEKAACEDFKSVV
ncbi:uncharacterized protein TNCV_915391 [Trichonephila clavipes]|nr:uncharacterized protein TNCV_915391 [Trichonephila clavipes]